MFCDSAGFSIGVDSTVEKFLLNLADDKIILEGIRQLFRNKNYLRAFLAELRKRAGCFADWRRAGTDLCHRVL